MSIVFSRRVFSLFFFFFMSFFALQATASDKNGVIVSIAGHTFNDADVKPDKAQVDDWKDDPMAPARKEIFKFSKVAVFLQRQFVIDFAAQNNLSANPEFVASFKAAFASDTLSGSKLDEMAEFSALQFTVDSFLYAQHGGRVVFDQSHPMMPVEAYFNAFKLYVENKRLVFHDKDTEQFWWLSFARPNALDIPAADVNFTTPWWHKLG